MKKYIYKINQYLLENYPTIWNTKIVWMLLISLAIHLFFFVIGYFTFTNPELLQERSAKDIFFENGSVFFSIIISILLIVLWLINLFKNNSFKNFYPTSKLKLFSQFICYVTIIFFATTFYFSYNVGFKQYISNKYTDEIIKDEISASNIAAVFFSHTTEKYTLDNLRYPSIFSELYCESSKELVDKEKPYLSWLGEDYQFYTLKSKDKKETDVYIDSIYGSFLFFEEKDSVTTTYFYKDSVVDISSYNKTAIPTYYNFSNTFYSSGESNYYGIDTYQVDPYNVGYGSNNRNSAIRNAKSKEVHELLKANDTEKIKAILQKLLTISNKYKVEHNLTPEKWMKLVYHPDKFELKSLIRTEPKPSYEYDLTVTAEQTAVEKFRHESLTDYYIETDNLYYVFENIEEIKETNVFEGSIHVFLWLSFFLAMLVYIFRVTGLKTFMFTIVAAGLLVVFVALTSVLYMYVANGSNEEYFILYFIFFISSSILFASIFLMDKIRKSIIAIALNLSLIGFTLYLFLIATIISMHQSNACRLDAEYKGYNDCFILLEDVGIYMSYIIFFAGFIFVYFYANTIKKWKGLLEG